MSDVILCTSKFCNNREKCYRFNAKSDATKSYVNFEDDCKKYNYRNMLELKDDEIQVSDICNLLARC